MAGYFPHAQLGSSTLLLVPNHPQAMAFAHMAFSCFFALALAGDHERCSSSDDVRIVCCVIVQSRVSTIDRCMLFELRISISTDFYVRCENRQAQQNSTQALEWAQRNGLAHCSVNLEIFGLAYHHINLEIWTSGFIRWEINDMWISATQYIQFSSQSEVCLIQLKLKDKHAAHYVEQIGSGSSGEV